jgi:nickel-type superoxide dismutase maturation protease
VALIAAAARTFRRIEVTGDSMRPTLTPGDRLLVWRWGRLRPGDLVALRDPRTGRPIVKRVAERGENRALTVVGDNADHSTDSRHFGPVSHSRVMGRIVYRYAPPHRTGPMAQPGTRW